MSSLVEVAEFVVNVLRLELDTPIRGFDGKDLGTSNQQAQALANRTLWLKEELTKIENIIDAMKDPDDVMKQHILKDDPHQQYLTSAKGKEVFVQKSTANTPLGFLQLDENGLLPSGIAKLYEARYLIVANETERLGIEKSKNITICLQTSDNIVYYLNPNADPSVPENWEKGESTELDRVVTVFGRLGAVVAEYGDYNADLIAETEKRLFTSPAEKETWNGKQDELVSGKNIGTVFGKSLLDGEDITLKDAKDLAKLLNGFLKGANGIEVSLDENEKIIIKGDGEKLPSLTIQDVRNAVAGKSYNFPLIEELNHDFFAWAAKEEILSKERTETFDATSGNGAITTSALPKKDSSGYFPGTENVEYELKQTTSSFENYITSTISLPAALKDSIGLMTVSAEKNTNALIPVFTKDNAPTVDGYTPFSSKIYGEFYPWKAFQSPMTETERKKIGNREYWSDNQIWRNRTEEVYLGIKSTSPMRVSSYAFQNFETYYWTTTSTEPTEWQLQGRNSDSEKWTTIDHQVNQKIRIPGDTWSTYQLSEEVTYNQLRILVLNVVLPGARASIPRVQFYSESGVIGKTAKGEYFSFDEDGGLLLLEPTDQTLFSSKGFRGTKTPVDIRELKENFPIQICGLNKGNVNVSFYITPRVTATIDKITSTNSSIGLSNISVTDYFSIDDRDNLKIAVSVDGKTYFTLTNDKWNNLGSIGNDDSGGRLLSLYGFSPALLETITSEKWDEIIDDTEGNTLKIISSKEIPNASVLPYPKSMKLSFDEVVVWERMSLDKVKISLTKKYLSFKPIESGTYKFAYRFM